jgi:hypothetical protein
VIPALMVSLTDLIAFFTGPVNPSAATYIAAAFTFVGGLFSLFFATVISRKGYVKLRIWMVLGIALLTGAQAVTWVSLTLPLDVPGWGGGLFRIGVGATWVSWGFTFWILYHVAMLELARFKAPAHGGGRLDGVKFGVSCIDDCLKVAREETPSRDFRYPVVIVADEQFRPWHILAQYTGTGLQEKEGVVYFAFNRPAANILDLLTNEFHGHDGKLTCPLNNLCIIDCHAHWTSSGGDVGEQASNLSFLRDRKQLFSADPRDPIEVGARYYTALEKLQALEVPRIRVVYDSISDFLCYSDPQLAVQFLEHNMVWEDNRVAAVYLYIRGVPATGFGSQVDQRFMEWHANSKVEFAVDTDNVEWVVVTGLFGEQRGARIDFPGREYKLLDADAFEKVELPQVDAPPATS